MDYEDIIKRLREQIIIYRKSRLFMTPSEVAEACGMEEKAVTRFECGETKFNMKIFLWYVDKGFDFNKALRGEYK